MNSLTIKKISDTDLETVIGGMTETTDDPFTPVQAFVGIYFLSSGIYTAYRLIRGGVIGIKMLVTKIKNKKEAKPAA